MGGRSGRNDYWENYYLRDRSGSGGNAGAGGIVTYVNEQDRNKIFAYNGNRITQELYDYSQGIEDYDEYGNKTGHISNAITMKNGKQSIPAIIFAQTGVIRSVWETNQHWSKEEANLHGAIFINDVTDYIPINYEISPRTLIEPSSYGQGIGSGAGNLEKDNGKFQQISK